jgi:hypothetical protein
MGEEIREEGAGPTIVELPKGGEVLPGVYVFFIGPGQIRTEISEVDPVVALGMLEIAKQTVLKMMGQGPRPAPGRILVPQVQVGV